MFKLYLKDLNIHHSTVNYEICLRFQQSIFGLSEHMLKLHKFCHYIYNSQDDLN